MKTVRHKKERLALRHAVAIVSLSVGLMSCSASHSRAAADRRAANASTVDELLRTMRVESQMQTSFTDMVAVMIRANPTLEPYRDILVDWAAKTMTWDQVGPELRDIYATTFSETEMQEIIRFYRSPTGQKVLDRLPEAMRRSLAAGAKLAELHREELQEMIAERARELNRNLPQTAP
jgi:hypothetical protein